MSTIPPHPIIVCSAVKCEYEPRPCRNITLFKGFSCSTECCLLMTFGCDVKKNAEKAFNMTYSYMNNALKQVSRHLYRQCIDVNKLVEECIQFFSVLCSAKLKMMCVTMFCEVMAVLSCTGISH